MFQKQNLLKKLQIPYQSNIQAQHNSKQVTYSPKVQYFSPRKNQIPNESNNRLKTMPYQQSSQSYSQYYNQNQNQRMNGTNSISGTQSYKSKQTRTQHSKNKIKNLQQIEQQQQNILKLKEKYSNLSNSNHDFNSKRLSQNFQIQRSNKLLISGKNQGNIDNKKPMKSGSNNSKDYSANRYLRTQNSKNKGLNKNNKNSNNQDTSNSNANQYQSNHVDSINNNNYTMQVNTSFKPKNYKNQESRNFNQRMNSPSQQYYSTSNQQELSRQLQRNNVLMRSNFANSIMASTVNTQNRASSLNLDRFSKKKMLTFYHCQTKKFYRYNDEGYLTDKQMALREKVQKAAQEALDKMIIQQQQESQVQRQPKSKSLGHFQKLNKLKEQAQKQRKRKYQLYGKYQESMQQVQSKSKGTTNNQASKYNPSQLPPSSSLSKNNKNQFKVIYKLDQNQNLLRKNQISDDSYHEREAKKKQKHIEEVKQNARSSIIKKIEQRKSQISKRNEKDSDSNEYYSNESQQQISKLQRSSNKKLNVPDQSPRGISRIGGITSDEMISSNNNIQSKASNYKSKNIKSESQKGSEESKSNRQASNNSYYSQYSQNPTQKQSKHKTPQNYTSSKRLTSQQNLASLQMINSNYKKIPFQTEKLLNEQKKQSKKEQKSSKSSQSLGLKTDTDKNKSSHINTQKQISKSSKIPILEPQKIAVNHQNNNQQESEQTLQQNFQQSQISKKQSQKSVKSGHVGLVRQSNNKNNLKRMSSKNSKQSNHCSQSVIELSLQKKSSSKKWVRDDPSFNNQSNSFIKMKKNKQKVQIINQIHNMKESKDIKELQIESIRKVQNRISLQSNSLKIDSLINVPKNSSQKYLKAENSKISQKGQSKLTNSKKQLSRMSSYESNSNNSKKENNNEKLKQSNISNKNSEENYNLNKSRLSSQRQSFRNKAKGKRENKRNSVKVSMNKSLLSENEQKQKSHQNKRYGNQLKVHNNSQKQFDSQSPSQSFRNQRSSKTVQQSSKSDVKKSSILDQGSNYSNSIATDSFNLIERAQQLLDIQDQMHQKRKKLQVQDDMTQQFNDLLAKIQAHIYILREILQVSTTAMDIYSQDSAWVFKSCVLSIKKYHLERIKVVQALRGKKSCFKVAQNQLTEQDLKQYLKNDEIKLLASDIEQCNELTGKLLQDYLQYLREYLGSQFEESQLNLRQFEDKNDIGPLLQQYKTQILGLRQKTGNNAENNKVLPPQTNSQVLEQQTQELINKRIFKLMQVGFLVSQLAGKRIKQFAEELDGNEQFQEYFNDQWPHFQRIVKTYS